MKRFLSFVLIAVLLLCLCGCSVVRTDITMDEIVSAYEAAGYQVSSGYYDEKTEWGVIGYIRADHPNGDYIYFSIFDNEENARGYKDKLYHPGVMGMFSFIFGDAKWMRWEVYGKIVVEYTNSETYKPFEMLLKPN